RQPQSSDRDINLLQFYADPDGDGDYDFLTLADIKDKYPELEGLIQESRAIPTERIDAPVSLEAFVSNYLAVRGIRVVSTFEPGGEGTDYHKYVVAAGHAAQEYERLYGRTAVTASLITTALSYVFPPARVMRPEVEFHDISGMEWGVGAAQVVLLGAPVIGGIAPKIIGGAARGFGVSRITATAIGTAAGRFVAPSLITAAGVFTTTYTAMEILPNPEIPVWQKVLAMGLNTVIIAAGVHGIVGAARSVGGVRVSSIPDEMVNSTSNM
ncbi:unnamed protein product, partial [marine sediment metagenome]